MIIEHLGSSGLALSWDGKRLAIDPPCPVSDPVVVTWSEYERLAGLSRAVSAAAAPQLLDWRGVDGTPLEHGKCVEFAGFNLCAHPYTPIPYATTTEAVRKTHSALRHPVMAANRLAHTLRRPKSSPLTLSIERGGIRIAYLGQALHRFLPEKERDALITAHRGADVLIAGTDFDDEIITGELMAHFDAKHHIVADLIGPVRRSLGLPTRPLLVTQDVAPSGTLALESNCRFRLELT